jgi:hypothetical protein
MVPDLCACANTVAALRGILTRFPLTLGRLFGFHQHRSMILRQFLLYHTLHHFLIIPAFHLRIRRFSQMKDACPIGYPCLRRNGGMQKAPPVRSDRRGNRVYHQKSGMKSGMMRLERVLPLGL